MAEENGRDTRFKPGQSGNPGGRPKGKIAELQQLAREHTPEAIRTLVSVMKGKRSPAAARVSAANALLDRGYGKPPQDLNASHDFPGYVPIPAQPRDVDAVALPAWTTDTGDRIKPS